MQRIGLCLALDDNPSLHLVTVCSCCHTHTHTTPVVWCCTALMKDTSPLRRAKTYDEWLWLPRLWHLRDSIHDRVAIDSQKNTATLGTLNGLHVILWFCHVLPVCACFHFLKSGAFICYILPIVSTCYQ